MNDQIYNAIYPGWGRTEAEADFREHPEKWTGYLNQQSGGGGAQSAEDYAKAVLEAQQKQIDEEVKFLEGYTKENPFVFDEALAKRSATAEYQPYYSELLDDYLKDVGLKRETVQDEVKLLGKMKEYDMGQRTREYEKAVSNAEEGFAGQGMFFSGIKQRATGEKEVDYKLGSELASEKYGTQERGYGRQLTGYDIAEEQKRRDIFGGDVALGGLAKYGERQGQYHEALESGVLQREKEAMTQYYAPLEQSYYRKFPAGSGSTLKGYSVPEYYRY